MLSTKKASHVYSTKITNKLEYVIGKDFPDDLEQFPNQTETQNQHLYIISNEEIKKG